MWEKIINWLNKIALINVVTPRRAVTAFIVSMKNADIDDNGELNIRELLRNMKQTFKALIFTPDMTDEEIHNALDEILSK